MAQSAKHQTSAQVMVSCFGSSSPTGMPPRQRAWSHRSVPLAAGSEVPRTAHGDALAVALTPSAHPSSQREFMGICPMADTVPGPGDRWVNVTDRSRPQAGTPRPHREQGLKDPKPTVREDGPSARERPAIRPSPGSNTSWRPSKTLGKTAKQEVCCGGPLPSPRSGPTFAGCPHCRPSVGCPERRREHPRPQGVSGE